ncbi:MAG: MBL fold metallo-hydrolase [Clostridium sp.]|jgi:ribonuclease BN (tRNA processing enzyme)|nr:MBL fold metallo-hydrolase [Clostridium sp.]
MNYKIISSCSTGNATIIRDIILIDCGVTFKKLEKYYKQLKIVLLTHIHSDHFKKETIKKLAQERPTLRFACCEWLLQPLLECGVLRKNIDVLQIGTRYDYKLFKIVPIKLYHDVPQCGYRVLFDDYKVIYMTDTRTVEGIVAKNYDLYLVEGNYEEEELEQRIKQKQEEGLYYYESRVRNTHLSKGQATDFLLNNMGENSEYVFMHEHVER